MKTEIYGKDLSCKKINPMLEKKDREYNLEKSAHSGASAILEIKITEIENIVVEKNKNLEIHGLTIPYLHLQKTLQQYLSKKEIKKYELRYENAMSKYWEIKK